MRGGMGTIDREHRANTPKMVAPEAPEPQLGLDRLPLDALAIVLRTLSVHDVLALARVNRGLRSTLGDERVWYTLCAREWPATDVRRWVVRPAGGESPAPVPAAPLPPPQTFREVYLLLHEVSQLVGLWRRLGCGHRSSLVSFSWAPDSLEGAELSYASLEDEVERVDWLSIRPRRPCVDIQSVDARMATLREHSARGAAMHRSPSAEAAAAVAMGSSVGSRSGLGSSPLGTSPFEEELQSFLSPMVQSRRRQQRRRPAQPGGGGREVVPVLHHLERVPVPVPSRKHPLVGLWRADCGPAHTVQILRLVMDFSGQRAARMLAFKVTGDDVVPAGRLSWIALAAALATPWPAWEQDLIAAQQERWLEDDGAWEETQLRAVAAVHMAWAQEGGGEVPAGIPDPHSLTDARLWVLSGDSMALCVVEAGSPGDVFEMHRIDPQTLQ